MNRIFAISSLALSLGCGAAFAQQTPDAQAAPQQAPDTQAAPQQTPETQGYRHHHSPNPQKQAEFIGRRFNLNPDQTLQIQHIMETRDQQVEALRQNAQLSPQDRHQQMRTLNQQSDQQLGTVLSPDQLAELKAMRHRHMHRQENGEPGQSPSA